MEKADSIAALLRERERFSTRFAELEADISVQQESFTQLLEQQRERKMQLELIRTLNEQQQQELLAALL